MGFNWQYVGIGSDNGLAPSRRQAIIWTNADPLHWRLYAALVGDKLMLQTAYWNGNNVILMKFTSS